MTAPFGRLFAYLRAPTPDVPMRTDWWALGAYLVATLAFVLAYSAVIEWSGIAVGGRSVLTEDMDSMSPAALFFTIAIVPPLVEELLFRSWLRGSGKLLAFLLGAVLLICAALAVHVLVPAIPMAFVMVAAGLLGFALVAQLATDDSGRIPRLFRRHYAIVFYASALLFGAMHWFNFEGYGLFTAFFVVPQTLMGLLLGHVRVHQGLPQAMLLHGAYNGTLVALFASGL